MCAYFLSVDDMPVSWVCTVIGALKSEGLLSSAGFATHLHVTLSRVLSSSFIFLVYETQLIDHICLLHMLITIILFDNVGKRPSIY